MNDRAMANSASATTADADKSTEVGEAQHEKFTLCEPIINHVKYNDMERYSLYVVLGVALAGLIYAGLLVSQVIKADKGTPQMQEIAGAVREGANAYLAAQFRKIGPLIIVITGPAFPHQVGPLGICFRPLRRLPRGLDL